MISPEQNKKLQYLINQAYVRKEYCHTKRTQDIFYYLGSKCLARVTRIFKYNKETDRFVTFCND